MFKIPRAETNNGNGIIKNKNPENKLSKIEIKTPNKNKHPKYTIKLNCQFKAF